MLQAAPGASCMHFVLVNSRELSNDGIKPDFEPEILYLTANIKARRLVTKEDVLVELRAGFPSVPKDTPLFYSHEIVKEWVMAYRYDEDTPSRDVEVVAGSRGRSVFVKHFTGETLCFTVTPTNTVRDLQWFICRRIGISSDNQRLVYRGSQLDPNCTLADVQPDSTLHLLARLRGGMLHQTSGRVDMKPLPAPVEAVPVEAAPVEAVPVEAAPVEAAPVEAAPVEAAPVEAVPVEAAPVEAAPVEAAPVEAAPAATSLG